MHERGRPIGRPEGVAGIAVAWRYTDSCGGSKGISCSTVSTKSYASASIVKSIGLKFTLQGKQRPRLVCGLTTAISSSHPPLVVQFFPRKRAVKAFQQVSYSACLSIVAADVLPV